MLQPFCAPRYFFGSVLVASLGSCFATGCGKPSTDGLYDLVGMSQDAGAAAGSGSAGSGGQGSGGATLDAGVQSAGGGSGGQSTIASGDGGSMPVDAGSLADSGLVPDASSAAVCVPSAESCDGVDNNCDGEVDEGATCVAGCTGFVLDDHGYKYCASGETVQAAEARCQLDNMRLAWIETFAEGAAVAALVGQLPVPTGFPDIDDQRPVRLGANDVGDEGEWGWAAEAGLAAGAFGFWEGGADGEIVGASYTQWANGQPNNNGDDEDCAALLVYEGVDGAVGEWNDVNCTALYFFVCEAPN